MSIKCRKCGCEECVEKLVLPHLGVYCKDCGTWIMWRKLSRVEKEQISADYNKTKSNYMANYMANYCEKCGKDFRNCICHREVCIEHEVEDDGVGLPGMNLVYNDEVPWEIE